MDQEKKTYHQAIQVWDLTVRSERRRRFAGDWVHLEALAFLPDGQTLVSGGTDAYPSGAGNAHPEKGSTRVWDLATGRERLRFSVEHCHISALTVAPNRQLVAAAVTDGSIRLYDLASGHERTLRFGEERGAQREAEPGAALSLGRLGGAPATMSCLAFSADGAILASGSSGTGNTGSTALADVFLWSVGRGELLRRFPAHQGWVTSLSFAPNGEMLATSGPDPVVHLWNVRTGLEAFPEPGHASRVRALAISPADGTIFTAGQDGTIRHWDPSDGRELGVIAAFPTPVDTMTVVPDGTELLIGGSLGGRLALWSVARRSESRSFPRVHPRNAVRHAVVSPDGKTVASERTVWDAATGRVLVKFTDPDEQNMRDANFFPIFYTPDGKRIITAENQGARIWDIASGKHVRWAVRAKIHTNGVALSPDARYLATGGTNAHYNGAEHDPAIRVWELASGREVLSLEGIRESTWAVAFSPDGRYLATGSVRGASENEPVLRLWDLSADGEMRPLPGHLGTVTAVVFSRDGRSVVSASDDATALVSDVSELTRRPKDARVIADDALKAHWNALGGDDAHAAYRSTWALSVPSAVRFLDDRLQPAALPDPEGVPAETGPIAPAHQLRALRAIAALERIETPAARAVLERLAGGNPGALQTREAGAALERGRSHPPDTAKSIRRALRSAP